MKNTIKLLLIFLLISIGLNIYQYVNDFDEDNNNIDVINKDCYIMYVNTFMNSDGIEFSLPPIKKCLLEDIFKKGYELNGLNNLILLDLLNQKEKYEFSDFSDFVKPLKERFSIDIETADEDAMLYALKFIDDKEFTKELIKKSLNGINKNNLIFYMRFYKEQGGNKDFLLDIFKNIEGKLDIYSNYIYNDEYNNLFKYFSK